MPRVARLRQAACAAAVACGLAACGTSTIIQPATEHTVAQFVFKETGFRPKDVVCPAGIAAQTGTSFTCHFTGPDGPYVATLRIMSVQGTRVYYAIATRRRS